MATFDGKDFTTGLATTLNKLPLGAAAKAASVPVTIATDDPLAAGHYETVAASQTAQVLGSTGAIGDVLYGMHVVPTTTSPGSIAVLDSSTSMPVFAGGASSLACLAPFWINLNGMKSVNGAFKITTGAGLSVIAVGKFT
jgi:hypothetical protein